MFFVTFYTFFNFEISFGSKNYNITENQNWVGKSGRLYQPFCMWTPPGGNEKNAPYYLLTTYRVTYVDNDTVRGFQINI